MDECNDAQHEQWVELSGQEQELVHGGDGLVIETTVEESAPYQGKRSSGGYVPT